VNEQKKNIVLIFVHVCFEIGQANYEYCINLFYKFICKLCVLCAEISSDLLHARNGEDCLAPKPIKSNSAYMVFEISIWKTSSNSTPISHINRHSPLNTSVDNYNEAFLRQLSELNFIKYFHI